MKLFKHVAAGAGVIFLAGALLSGCGQNNTNKTADSNKQVTAPQELIISAAASLKDSLQEVGAKYQKEHADVKLEYNFSSSGALEQQIEQGAPADLFFSAGKKEMDTLQQKQLIDSKFETNLLTNQLVLITPSNNGATLSAIDDLERPDIHKVAVGEPASVPAGRYTKQALQHDQLWQPLQNKLIFAKDVRQVLSYVETGNVDAGFVYKTDAMTSKQVKIALPVNPSSYQPIDYPVGVVKSSKHQELAQQFYNFLQGNEATAIFEKYGFSLVKK